MTTNPFARLRTFLLILLILCSAVGLLPAEQFGNFTYRLIPGGVEITDYSTTKVGAVAIPATIDGKNVISIGDRAFSCCARLTAITIPNTVTSIGWSAFDNCAGLTRVIIPNSVTSIDSDAFFYCTGLTSVTLSNSVTSIGSYAFCGCRGLTSVTIPNSVTSIGYGAFDDCTALTAITVDASNPNYSSLDGVLFNKAQWLLVKYPGGKSGVYPIPNSVTSIESSAFRYCAGLTSVTIPNSVTSIGDYAFRDCTALTSVTIPSSVTTIGFIAFSSCTALTAITVDATNPNYSSLDGVLFDKAQTSLLQYPGGKSGAYPIPNSVTSIESGAFRGCRGLTSVTIPNSVTSIGFGAFDDCTALTAITVDASNPNFSSLDGVLFNKDQSLLVKYPGGKSGAYPIPNSVTSIEDNAFSFCAGLTSVTIPNSITSIGSSAFSYCTALTCVTIPYSVTYIGAEAFLHLTSAIFLGDAPVLGTAVFGWSAGGVTVFYADGRAGFTTPTWNGYPTANIKDVARIHGVVSNPTSSPLAGVKVDCRRNGWNGHAFTAAAGEYELLVLPGHPYALVFDPTGAGGYARRRIEFQAPSPGDYEKNVILEAGITITGTVTEKGTAAPLGGIRVEYWNDDEGLWVGSWTDGNGHYALRNLPKGWGEVGAHPEHTYAGAGVDREFPADSAVDFALDVEATISGVVYDAVSSTPISDVHIISWNEASSIWTDTYSDDQGQFTLSGLPAGIAEVSARPEPGIAHGGRYFGWSNRNVRLSSGQHFDCCLFLLEEAALISGHVTDGTAGGVPIPGVRIHASNMFFDLAEVDTDQSGYYDLRLPVGTHEVEIDRDECPYLSLARTVRVTSPADHQTIDFATYDGTTAATISGQVTNPGGYPIDANARLQVVAFNAGADIGIDFLYSFDDLVALGDAAGFGTTYSLIAPPNAEYDLYLVTKQDSGAGETAVVRNCRTSVMAGAAGTISPNQDLSYDSEGGSITGTVTANGKPLANAEVFLKHPAGAFWGFARSDSSGVYRFDNVPAGEFTVQADHWDYGRSPEVAASGVTDGGMLDEVNMDITVNYVALGIHGVSAGVASIFFETVADGNYTIEISGDLADWFPVQTKTGDGSVMTWTDPAATTPARFYRVFHE